MIVLTLSAVLQEPVWSCSNFTGSQATRAFSIKQCVALTIWRQVVLLTEKSGPRQSLNTTRSPESRMVRPDMGLRSRDCSLQRASNAIATLRDLASSLKMPITTARDGIGRTCVPEE